MTKQLIDKIDITSRTTFFATWAVATLSVCTVEAIATHTVFSNHPIGWNNAEYAAAIQDVFLVNLITNAPVILFFLLLLRHLIDLRRQLGFKIRHDSLTGLLSRDAFLTDFAREQETRTAERRDALLVIDADYFKHINDTYGHATGDQALVAITTALRKGIRDSDAIGRIGGEEFAIHLKNVELERAKQIADRLRVQVKEASDTLGIPELKLSVSIGLVGYSDNIVPGQLIEMADRLLYKAKEAGRNCIVAEQVKEAVAA